MMEKLESDNQELLRLIEEWEIKLIRLSVDAMKAKNSQGRTIKQIVGHMIDSASNNIHRIVHMQYQPTPLIYPDYAALGNNDRWIAIQNYQAEEWDTLVQLWKYSNIHIVHVIRNVDESKLDNEWITAMGDRVSLRAMIADYPRHFKLHLNEIDELVGKNIEEAR